MTKTPDADRPERDYAITRSGTVKLYDWPLAERFSRCKPTTPLFVFLPLIGVLLYLAVATTELSVLAIAGWALVGLVAWTLLEYWLHRTIFHLTGESEALKTFHRRVHGCHHEFPNDMERIVMPPAASIPMTAGLFVLTWFALGEVITYPFFAGMAVGYLWYDMTHWWTHTTTKRGRWGKLIRKHHMTHHFSTPDRQFGVSSPLWDWVFRTH